MMGAEVSDENPLWFSFWAHPVWVRNMQVRFRIKTRFFMQKTVISCDQNRASPYQNSGKPSLKFNTGVELKLFWGECFPPPPPPPPRLSLDEKDSALFQLQHRASAPTKLRDHPGSDFSPLQLSSPTNPALNTFPIHLLKLAPGITWPLLVSPKMANTV